MQKNYYVILGITINAGAEEIKAAYRLLAKKYHPDTNQGSAGSEEYFKEIQEAYAVLSNPEKRRKYDLKLNYGQSTTQRKTAYTQYGGNAYQYAQQQAQQQSQHRQQQQRQRAHQKPDKSENYYILVSIGIAMVLLYFIISYSTGRRNERADSSDALQKTTTKSVSVSQPESEIHEFDSPYSYWFGEEQSDQASKSSVVIHNSEGYEVVVCLVRNDAPRVTIRNQYIARRNSFKMNHIPDGNYFLRIYYGSDWDSTKTFPTVPVHGGFRRDSRFVEMNSGKKHFRMKQKREGNSISFSSYEIGLSPSDTNATRVITSDEFFRKN